MCVPARTLISNPTTTNRKGANGTPARHFHASDDSLEMTSLQTGHVLDPTYEVDVAMDEIVDMATEIATDSLV